MGIFDYPSLMFSVCPEQCSDKIWGHKETRTRKDKTSACLFLSCLVGPVSNAYTTLIHSRLGQSVSVSDGYPKKPSNAMASEISDGLAVISKAMTRIWSDYTLAAASSQQQGEGQHGRRDAQDD